MNSVKSMMELLNNPMILFALMILTQLFSIIGQWYEAKKTGSTMTLGELFSYWPQLILGFGMSVSAFFALLESNTLNFASAIGISAAVNKFSDLLATRRTKAIVDSIPAETDHGARR